MKRKRLITLLIVGTISISTIFNGCAGKTIDAEAKGAEFNEEEISLGFLNFMAKYQQAIYDGNYLSMFGNEMWTQDLYGDGSTFQESVKKEIITELEELLVLQANMEDYKVTVTEEETKEIEAVAKQFMEDNTKKAIKQLGATEDYVRRMLNLQTIRSKMYNKIIANVDKDVSDEEAAQRTFSYIQVNKTSKTDENGQSVNYTEKEKTELETNVDDFVKAAKEDFEKAAEEKGYTVSTYSYGKDDDSFEKTVLEAADKLKEGELSKVISTETDFYVVRLDKEFDEEATTQKKETIRSQRETDRYTEVIEKLKKDAKFTLEEKEWEKINFDQLFTIKATEEEAADDATEEETADDDAAEEAPAETDADNKDAEDETATEAE